MENYLTTAVELESEMADELKSAYAAAEAAKTDMLRKAVEFGTRLIRWEKFIGRSKGGRGCDGEGLKGWLSAHCPEINYKSATVYKSIAQKTVLMLGGGEMAQAALLGMAKVARPDGEIIDVDAEIIEKREDLFAEATSRRKLEQMWFDFSRAAAECKAGRPVGTGGEYHRKSPVESAVAIVYPLIDRMLKHRSALFSAYRLLPEDKLREALATIEEQVSAIKAEIASR